MFTSDNTMMVLTHFLKHPSEEWHLRAIARKVGLSPAGTLKILRKLEEKGYIRKEKTPLKDNYRANLENKEYEAIKQAYNLYLIRSSGIIEHLEKTLIPQSIVLFGSFARGDNHAGSDIDIALIKAKRKEAELTFLEKRLGHAINLHFINDFKSNKELKNNIINGITLKGFMKVL